MFQHEAEILICGVGEKLKEATDLIDAGLEYVHPWTAASNTESKDVASGVRDCSRGAVV